MVECDNCDGDVPEVWRRRTASETMTHRTVSWLCRSCHPSVPATRERPTTATTVAMTDGGSPTTACPACGGATVGGQGLLDCQACAWSGTL